MNNLIKFPTLDSYLKEADDFKDLCDYSGIEFWDMSQVPENSDIPTQVYLSPPSEEVAQSILDMQARINYYLNDIKLLGQLPKN